MISLSVSHLTETIVKWQRTLCMRLGSLSHKLCSPQYLSYAAIDPSGSDIMVLRPEDYWVRRINLNVSSEKEAAKYGYSLFDLDEELVCYARKVSAETYDVVGFNPQKIMARYPELFSLSSERSVTFAQWVFDRLEVPIKLPNGRYLSLHEGIVFEMEGHYLDVEGSLGIEEIEKKPFYGLKTILVGSMVPSSLSMKTLKITVVLLALLVANIVMEGYKVRSVSEQIGNEMETLNMSSGLHGVSMERNAIIDTLRYKEAKQLTLRERCYKLRDIGLKPSAAESIPPSAPIMLSSMDQSGIVLIPGSKPGEPNRLLVNGVQNTPSRSLKMQEGIQEIVFDGKKTLFVFKTSEPQSLKKMLMKRFRNSRIEEHGGRIEVRFK